MAWALMTFASSSGEVVAFAVVFTIVGVLFVALPLYSAYDAVNVPASSWTDSGHSRGAWLVSFFIFPLGVNVVSSIDYWTWLSHRLPGGSLRVGDHVEIADGPHSGAAARIEGRYLLGTAGIWTASVETPDGTATVQVSSNAVRRVRGY